jgi:hypothetical protein
MSRTLVRGSVGFGADNVPATGGDEWVAQRIEQPVMMRTVKQSDVERTGWPAHRRCQPRRKRDLPERKDGGR